MQIDYMFTNNVFFVLQLHRASLLEEAIGYIKSLQQQLQVRKACRTSIILWSCNHPLFFLVTPDHVRGWHISCSICVSSCNALPENASFLSLPRRRTQPRHEHGHWDGSTRHGFFHRLVSAFLFISSNQLGANGRSQPHLTFPITNGDALLAVQRFTGASNFGTINRCL